mgnify:CR=1 FL=1
MADTPREFDIVVYGATGYTGRLVAEHFVREYGGKPDAPKWAMAGRSKEKLAEVRDLIGAPADTPLVIADASDPGTLDAMCHRTRVVLTTVGPYQLYGDELVGACVRSGTDYADLCGEPVWMRQKIDEHEAAAKASGARICFSSGFDSIPFDLGVLYLQHEAQKRLGQPLVRVHGRVKVMKGGFSGGTAASLLASVEAAGRDPAVARTLRNPYALVPGFEGPRQPDDGVADYDELAQSWTAPFVMAPINTKNVHRTHALRGHPWGTGFIYSERMLTGDGPAGEKRARALARQAKWQNLALDFGPTRALIRRFVLPQPGQGPTREQREKGRYEVRFIGVTADGQVLKASVKGDRDPGYGSTCKLISETALCLLEDVDRGMAPGGVWTPGAAMGLALVRRLSERAGLSFSVG